MADKKQTTKNFSIGDVKVDTNKTPEEYIKDVEPKYIVPPLIREKFKDLVKLIFETESMDNEEREYWLQIMPVMSEEQVLKLRDIMVKERDQLEQIDKDYKNKLSRSKPSKVKPLDEEELKRNLAKIRKEEKQSKQEEKEKAEALLEKLENL